MTNIWFIRHGESMANAGEVAVDRGSTLLSEKGQQQARDVSLKVPTRPDLIVITPYTRTHQTAQPLRERYPGVPCETWDLYEYSALSEENYVHKTWVQRHPAMQALWERNDPDYVDGTGAESFADMTRRVKTGLDRLRGRPEKFIVVFAHGYIIQTTRLMLSKPQLSLKALMKSVPHYMEHSPIENCAVIRVEMDAKGMRVHEEDLANLATGHAFEGD